MSQKKQAFDKKIIASNRKARYEYFILDTYEAGIVLFGSELKSLRAGKSNIAESYIDENNGELFMLNSYIAEYNEANQFNHYPKRPRKLLMHKREIKKFIGKLKTEGITMIPLSIYFNEKNRVKLEIALAKGKKLYDKRETEKQRDWDKQKQRLLKNK